MAVGCAAALAFATGERVGLVLGAVLLQAAFTLDCVDGQLARYTRQFSQLGAWLDSVFDRGKEYVVYAGLAFGALRTGDDVWLLAAAALALQTTRHLVDFSFAAAQAVGTAEPDVIPLAQVSDQVQPADEPPVAYSRATLGPAATSAAATNAAATPAPATPAPATPVPATRAPATSGAGLGVAVVLDSDSEAAARAPGGREDDLAAVFEDSRPDWLTDADHAPQAGASGSSSGADTIMTGLRRRARTMVRFWHRLGRPRWALWFKRILVLPIGERFALISVLAALTTPRLTFQVLLAWGVVALSYGLAGRALRSVAT
jgi:hypothetical protein